MVVVARLGMIVNSDTEALQGSMIVSFGMSTCLCTMNSLYKYEVILFTDDDVTRHFASSTN